MFKSENEAAAEKFVKQVKSLLRRQDGLIYSVESNVSKSGVISPSTIGNRIASVNIVVYNRAFPENAFDHKAWLRLGQLGADVETWGCSTPELEVMKEFE